MLSLQEHVARRSVERSYRNRELAVARWEDLCVEVDRGVAPLFASGRRLREGDVARLAEGAAGAFERLDPLVVLDHVRAPTRGRPHSEEREILCVAPYAGEADGRPHIELCAARIWLSRKRAVIETSSTLARITTHAMARAIVRSVVKGDEEVDRRTALCLLDNAGLMVLGRSLAGGGDLDEADTFVLPFEGGLVLGAFLAVPDPGRDRLSYDASGRFPRNPPPSSLVTDTPGRPGGTPLAYRGSTVIGAKEMTRRQGDLHAAMTGFSRRHADLLRSLGEAALWPDTALRPLPPLPDRERWEAAVAELRGIVLDPVLRMREGGRPGPRSFPGLALPRPQGNLDKAARSASSIARSSGVGTALASTIA